MSDGLADRLVAALFAHATNILPPESPERMLLADPDAAPLDEGAIRAALAAPDAWTRRMDDLARALDLSAAEVAAVGIAALVEADLLVGRILAALQHPVGGSRPTIGFIRSWLAGMDASDPASLVAGRAMSAGLLVRLDPARPLPEQALAVPGAVVSALAGQRTPPPGVWLARREIAVPPSLRAAAEQQARTLENEVLVIRAGNPRDARATALELAEAIHRAAAVVEADAERTPGLGPWLRLVPALPVLERRLAPGERLHVRAIPGWSGPILVCTGPDGVVVGETGVAASFRVRAVPPAERGPLWAAVLGDGPTPRHRHGPARIDEIGRLARRHARAAGREAATAADLRAASLDADGGGLSAHAQLLPEWVPQEALVLPDRLQDELALVEARCRWREDLGRGLGVAATTRLHPGVRCLFIGPPGTGKTLAAGWIAGRLELPLYRVDIASVVSKYIGETERNLAELLALAEAAEVVLLFDEADALFGKRTDVRHSTDRFANAQTNYLLQRIESYDGIVVLTSNSRERFDDALFRRLDVVVEFPLPAPAERRALWVAHLGSEHTLRPAEINRLSTHCDLAGGHVRNVVLTAAVHAMEAGRPIGWNDLEKGLGVEYRKLGRVIPHGLVGSG